MADEPAPQAGEPASDGDAAAPAADAQAPAPAPEAPPAKPSVLPLILTPILCAASAFGVIHFAVNNSLQGLKDDVAALGKKISGEEEKAKDKKKKEGDGKAAEGEAAEGDAPADDDPKKPVLISDRGVVINPGDGGVMLVKIALLRQNPSDYTFPKKVADYAERLKEKTLQELDGKSMETLNKPGFKDQLRGLLEVAYEEVLGPNSVERVIISEWVSQP